MNLLDMSEDDFDAAHNAHFMAPRRGPYVPLGCDQQGRYPDRIPDAGPQAACELGMGDAEEQIDAYPWGIAAVVITLAWLAVLVCAAVQVWRNWP